MNISMDIYRYAYVYICMFVYTKCMYRCMCTDVCVCPYKFYREFSATKQR